MRKFSCLAVAISISLSSFVVYSDDSKSEDIPVLKPENQHVVASKRINAKFTREHFKSISIDDALSQQIFDRYIKQLDFSRNIFLASDIKKLQQYREQFDTVVERGDLDIAYDIYNLNMERRVERFEYALSLLAKPFDFTLDESYEFDREEAEWPKDTAELNELWRKKVKYDALSLTLAKKEWPKIQETLTKRYNYAIKRINKVKAKTFFKF